jgi:hypothetical protein
MPLSTAQLRRYRAIWGKVCDTQRWKANSPEAEAARRSFHQENGFAPSSRDFSGAQLDRFEVATAPLRNDIDIRDRDRDALLRTIDRLSIGIAEVRGLRPGQYERVILRDWADTNDVDKLPTTSPDRRDLVNFSRTLKDRLSKMMTAVKEGRTKRPDLLDAWIPQDNSTRSAARQYKYIGNNRLIDALLAGYSLTSPQPYFTPSDLEDEATPQAPCNDLADDDLPF